MTIAEAYKRLLLIREAANEGDNERAHNLERALHTDALSAIADGASGAQHLAEAALESRTINFPRHCA